MKIISRGEVAINIKTARRGHVGLDAVNLISSHKMDKAISSQSYKSIKETYYNNALSFPSEVVRILSSEVNPYTFFCQNVREDPLVMKNIRNNGCYAFIIEFYNYVSQHNNEVQHLLTSSLQLSAFDILKILEPPQIQKAIIQSFSLSLCPELLVPLLKNDLKVMPIFKVGKLISYLEYESYFSINEVIIPLFLNNKMDLLEKTLEACPSLREEFLKVLDQLVGGKLHMSDIIYSCNCKAISISSFSVKSISKLLLRLMQKFNISLDLCPFVIERQHSSSLKYWFYKHYSLRELHIDSLILFAEELCGNNLNLQQEAIDLFIDNFDCYSGVIFVNDMKVPTENIPPQILSLRSDENKLLRIQMKRSEKDQTQMKPIDFYSLSIPFTALFFIDSVSKFDKKVEIIKHSSVIGLDVEWKPVIRYKEIEEISLIQIATKDAVYLFDVLTLKSFLTLQQWQKLGRIFADELIEKLVFSMENDYKILCKFFAEVGIPHMKLKNSTDLHKRMVVILDACPQYFSFKGKRASQFKGLSEMVFRCFGKPLNKLEQCSYWKVRPLSRSQLLYAALDAHCLIDIYNYLNAKYGKLKCDNWKSLSKSENKSPVKKKSFEGIVKPSRTERPASSLKIVCDSMVQGLGRILRQCNVDTKILNSNDDHDVCITLYEKEQRTVLTRGRIYDRFRKFVPSSHVICIKSDDVHKQLEQVVTALKLVIRTSDIFARCTECNCPKFQTMKGTLLLKNPFIKSSVLSSGNESKTSNARKENQTDNFIEAKICEVPRSLLKSLSVVYVCEQCGKCYWDGTHLDRFRHNIREFIVS